MTTGGGIVRTSGVDCDPLECRRRRIEATDVPDVVAQVAIVRAGDGGGGRARRTVSVNAVGRGGDETLADAHESVVSPRRRRHRRIRMDLRGVLACDMTSGSMIWRPERKTDDIGSRAGGGRMATLIYAWGRRIRGRARERDSMDRRRRFSGGAVWKRSRAKELGEQMEGMFTVRMARVELIFDLILSLVLERFQR